MTVVRTARTSTWSLKGAPLKRTHAFSRLYNRPCPWQGPWEWDSHARSRVAGTTDRIVHRPLATNRVKTRVKDHPAQTDRQDGRTDEGTKPDRRSTRGAEKPCWCPLALDQVEWVVPSCSPSSYRDLSTSLLMQDNVDYSGYPRDDLLLRHDFDYVREKSETSRSIEISILFMIPSRSISLFSFSGNQISRF